MRSDAAKILVLSSLLALAGCNEAMDVQVSKNGAEAKLIAEVDGCRLWRLNDGWRDVYVARCPEGAVGVQHEVSCGKSCRRAEFTVAARDEDTP